MLKRSRYEDDFEDDDESENWLASYSDLVTDLMAVFVLLFSFALINQAYVRSAALEVVSTFDSPAPYIVGNVGESGEGALSVPSGDAEQSDAQKDDAQGADSQDASSIQPSKADSLFEAIKAYIKEAGLASQLSVAKKGDQAVLLRMADSALFDSAKAEINPTAGQLLGSISGILTEYMDDIQMVRIEGHTDNRPINTKQFNSNWELSTSRAVNVLRRLLEISPLEPEQFSAVGYSEFYPISDNDTAAGRALNRRVDFIIETVSAKE